jgi:hypothetical protein
MIMARRGIDNRMKFAPMLYGLKSGDGLAISSTGEYLTCVYNSRMCLYKIHAFKHADSYEQVSSVGKYGSIPYEYFFCADNELRYILPDTDGDTVIIKREGDTLNNPVSLDAVRGWAYIPGTDYDGIYWLRGLRSSPFLLAKKRDGDTFSDIVVNSSIMTGVIVFAVVSPDASYAAVSNGNVVSVLKRSGDVFDEVQTVANTQAVFMTQNLMCCASGQVVTLYRRSGDAFYLIASLNSTSLAINCISPNEKWLYANQSLYIIEPNGIRPYKVPLTTFSQPQQAMFSKPDGMFLAVASRNNGMVVFRMMVI